MMGNRGLVRGVDRTKDHDHSQPITKPARAREIIMKVRLTLIGMAAGLVLPPATANAAAVVDPGLNRAGAGAELERGATPSAENFGRNENENNGAKGDCGPKSDCGPKPDKDPCKPK